MLTFSKSIILDYPCIEDWITRAVKISTLASRAHQLPLLIPHIFIVFGTVEESLCIR